MFSFISIGMTKCFCGKAMQLATLFTTLKKYCCKLSLLGKHSSFCVYIFQLHLAPVLDGLLQPRRLSEVKNTRQHLQDNTGDRRMGRKHIRDGFGLSPSPRARGPQAFLASPHQPAARSPARTFLKKNPFLNFFFRKKFFLRNFWMLLGKKCFFLSQIVCWGPLIK